ncbi:DNA phosphorothioation-dependent restriction protein DptF [Halieaceae bacterium IMCC14734]|uniref:DNA phosphorothioation-dependent restriction protein DptF n=1 Tax=Candidatus Litorirhabdus singularis TaxID=2518993 RepID=A0ABT3TKN3_9GAMM|nr:DNA phosphorothioation-dependent restriction protein DptF [Candidatus Litorirhabdus singularis]MCX2982870.1 DNA phosphorothioation-dependent restriction protein DptF [Candidatus Litorirhabdus singularis]
MRLKKALSMLSKSSPYAVSTVGESIDKELEKIKQYLYVETDIERAFREKLNEIQSHEIIFLCGSSGDGKSEILTRYREAYQGKVDFHLDATHSFKPDDTAVETLDSIFAKFTNSDRPLVVGINIGMLGNYEREGDDAHSNVRSAIKCFLEGEQLAGDYTFIDFEAFPKFQIVNGEVDSEFFSGLMDKVVKDEVDNPFREALNEEISRGTHNLLVANFLLLGEHSVQKIIVELLLCARIRKDQFITARMLLDFVYCLLTGPGYLFDNLFSGGDNELLAALADFDPSIIRNKQLDLFVIHRTLDFRDDSYLDFVNELESRYRVKGDLDPTSLIRCFYLLKSTELENGYHLRFSDSFDEASLTLYKKIWQLHKEFDGSSESRALLKPFYNEIVLLSINKYANKNASYLTKDEFYISSHGLSDLAAEVDIAISYPRIQADEIHDISEFNLHIIVNEDQLEPVPVNVNLLAMMMDICAGFRPNKHNKNSVVLLDELVNKITRHASNSKVLFLHRNGLRIKIKENPDGDIRVGGL